MFTSEFKQPRKPKSRKSRTPLIRMDPDCAICSGAASLRCDCEAKALETAISQAERRMMQGIYQEIREWARGHAQDYILEYFNMLSERRKAAHTEHIDRITQAAYYHYRSPPHPGQLAEAQQALKRGIDEDWKSSVQRYPEVLQYFFSLVELALPPDDHPSVKDAPLSALSGSRKSARRPPPPATIASGFHPPEHLPPARASPPPQPPPQLSRRTPGPRPNRNSYRGQPPPPPTYYGPGSMW
ncbi:hypothetical protein jhhlp_003548 [Lomentospora prolificans]|uniref:Uncharacterized protein n=1 Tax=Lomentospora prolificans TaxID=41688 RepID=A0A2N3N932_9PEZI|nr:hypothetical protein jhhlp_003548 [Lomentospora prolificans]